MKYSRNDIIFRCDSHHEVGFGHLSRCISIASKLLNREPQIKIAFKGEFSKEALGVLRKELPWIQICKTEDRVSGLVGVMDMMFDPLNPDYYNVDAIDQFSITVGKSIILTSSKEIPLQLNVDIVIGHLLKKNPIEKTNYCLYAGLEYAPVSKEFRNYVSKIKNGPVKNIVIAFGGGKNIDGPKMVLKALKKTNYEGNADVLLSPLAEVEFDELKHYSNYFITNIHQNLMSIAQLIYKADMVICTYGHLTYEALCLGIPVIVIGIKDFQVAYARALEREGLLLCAGHIRNLACDELVGIIKNLDSKSLSSMSRNGQKKIDKYGYDRIVEIIENELPLDTVKTA